MYKTQEIYLNKILFYLNELSRYARKLNIHVRAYEDISQLESFSEPELHEILRQLYNRISVFSELDSYERYDLDIEFKLLNKFLHLNNLHLSENIERMINFGDIIEIYDVNFKQLYGNLQFLKFCSYDLFTLHSTPFYNLYSRDNLFNKQILDILQKCFDQFNKIEPFAVEPHFLKEVYLKNNKIFKVHPKWIMPVFDKDKKTVACLLTNHCTEHKIQLI